jgi:hypothetical protein
MYHVVPHILTFSSSGTRDGSERSLKSFKFIVDLNAFNPYINFMLQDFLTHR